MPMMPPDAFESELCDRRVIAAGKAYRGVNITWDDGFYILTDGGGKRQTFETTRQAEQFIDTMMDAPLTNLPELFNLHLDA